MINVNYYEKLSDFDIKYQLNYENNDKKFEDQIILFLNNILKFSFNFI